MVEDNPAVKTVVAVPYGVTWPLEESQTAKISIGKSVMVPEGYHLTIECITPRANPKPNIVWHFGDSIVQGPQYTVDGDGRLVINSVIRDRDEGVYTCIADTQSVGQDKSSSTVIVTGRSMHLGPRNTINIIYLFSSSENQQYRVSHKSWELLGPHQESGEHPASWYRPVSENWGKCQHHS